MRLIADIHISPRTVQFLNWFVTSTTAAAGWWKAPAAGNVVGNSGEHDVAPASSIT